jgi:hypothetical protein
MFFFRRTSFTFLARASEDLSEVSGGLIALGVFGSKNVWGFPFFKGRDLFPFCVDLPPVDKELVPLPRGFWNKLAMELEEAGFTDGVFAEVDDGKVGCVAGLVELAEDFRAGRGELAPKVPVDVEFSDSGWVGFAKGFVEDRLEAGDCEFGPNTPKLADAS